LQTVGSKWKEYNCRTVCTTGSVLFAREAHLEESAADRQSNDTSVPGDIAECCSVTTELRVTLHLVEPATLIPKPFPLYQSL
jgi:hypothetical protein